MFVMLLYFLLQNSGKPLQGIVFVAAAELVVDVAVWFVVEFIVLPPMTVTDADVVATVICEFEGIEVVVIVSNVPFAEVVRVKVTGVWAVYER